MVEVRVPVLPKSEDSAVVSRIYVQEGQTVAREGILFDIETDKVVLEVPAISSGVVMPFTVKQGDHVVSEQLLMTIASSDNDATPQANIAPAIEDSTLAKYDNIGHEKVETAQEPNLPSSNNSGLLVGLIIGIALGVVAMVFF